MGIVWYYQNYIFQDPDYQKKNEIKQLEEKQKFLELEIDRILKETSLKDYKNKNSAQIYNK